jgi:hypothetical protein
VGEVKRFDRIFPRNIARSKTRVSQECGTKYSLRLDVGWDVPHSLEGNKIAGTIATSMPNACSSAVS